jgi:multiple sugar transport system substrate-binding protein
MDKYSRRSVLRGSLGLAAAAALSKPYIANAAATTATVWVQQGFVPAEDNAFKELAADYMKASGNTLDYSIMPFLAQNQKTVSALTTGDVPDLIFMDAPQSIIPQNAWDDKLVDVSDIVKPYEAQLSKTAKECSTFYNKTSKAHSYYLAPIKQACIPFHIWGSLVEKAGLKLSDAPKTWDAFWDFFKPAQKELRGKGMRKIYALGLQITTVGPNDGNGLFQAFVIANGGNMVTPDGRLHTDDPKVREAAIKSVAYLTDAYKQGYIPPEALSWNDADDNNSFHEKVFLVDFDGTISTELAMIKDTQAYMHDVVTMGLPNGNDGQPMAAQVGAGGGFIPKGARNVEVAKDLMKYWMQPNVMNANLKAGLGRWVPAVPQVVKDDPWWTDPADPHRAPYVGEAVLGPTTSNYEGFNPAWGQVSAEQLWGQAHADVIKNGMTPQQAIDRAFKRAEQIFSQVTF